MTDKRRGDNASARRWFGVVLSCVVCLPAYAAAQEVNAVEKVRTAGAAIEIQLHSSREFPVRDQVVILRIGKKEFSKSRYPADGSLNTLIFTLTPDQFAQLNDGEAMTVQYGRHDPGVRWNFGKLNKALLAE